MRLPFVLFGVVLLGFVAPAVAEESPLYGGLRIGNLDADFAGFGKATNVGVVLGYDVNRDQRGTLAIEAEATTTLTDGSVAGGGN